ncbi:hypothetical protein CONLIGDRAFT_297427 [Coniochaeta ligniaria NRRL 30616]|uniref:Uncharacterized protein n=1 Tax=Coniochaeta ligniaria NRRL 30616 TaxID=1408157 RepID=A0A1J7JTH6_9PEZI|nr:hypothetical protein CONLIGDRAFT_297427 [Coniochaeta ligniaria NRRL 30616]
MVSRSTFSCSLADTMLLSRVPTTSLEISGDEDTSQTRRMNKKDLESQSTQQLVSRDRQIASRNVSGPRPKLSIPLLRQDNTCGKQLYPPQGGTVDDFRLTWGTAIRRRCKATARPAMLYRAHSREDYDGYNHRSRWYNCYTSSSGLINTGEFSWLVETYLALSCLDLEPINQRLADICQSGLARQSAYLRITKHYTTHDLLEIHAI